MGRPKFKSRKNTRQSVRFTRNGFTIRPSRVLYLAKIGDLRVRWSRELPSAPSSVTVVREPDGHFYASFVVEIEPLPLTVVEQQAGIDLGIARLATVATTARGRLDIPNPKHLARKQRKLARLQREKARRTKDSRNRDKSRRKVAVQHGKVARARRDYHHKQALRLIRENQAVFVEDLNIAGMVRNRRLARAIYDAGWAQFIRLLMEKAERCGRTVHRVSRWLPSSKTCSLCGVAQLEMPLNVRLWTCGCGAIHDRDYNAAVNILAAGQAERPNDCGTHVRPPFGEAAGDEAGTAPDVA